MSKGKYYKLILSLEDHELYSTFAIADLAVDFYKIRQHGYARKLIRKAMYSRTKSHQFPVSGDRALKSIGHAEVPAWYGWRWKKSLEDPQPQTIRRGEEGSSGFRFWRFFVLGLSLLALVGLSMVGPSKLLEGYAIMSTRGAAEAYRFFTEHESNGTLIGKGWSALGGGRYAEAHQIALMIVERGKAGNKADGYYLLGNSDFFLFNYLEAEKSLLKAANLYEEQKYFKDASKAYLGLANLSLIKYDPEDSQTTSELENASMYLREAGLRSVPTPNYFYTKAQLSIELGDLAQALALCEQGILLSKDNKVQQVTGLIKAGFIEIMSGNLDESTQYSRKAESIIVELGDSYNYIFNLCNQYLTAKCYGRDNAIDLEEIKAFSSQNPNPFLRRTISVIQNFHCASARTSG